MPTTIQAAVLRAAGAPLDLHEVTLADPGPTEVLVRTMSTGICGTDLHFAGGVLPYSTPTVLGHEASGVIEAAGADVTGFAVGDRVIVCDQMFCGRCADCQSGQMVYCTDPTPKRRQRTRLSIDAVPARQYLGVSSFAEMMLVDANNLIAMPAGLSFDAAALLSCCLATGLATVFNVARPAVGSRVAVFGCGGVGLGAIQAARIAGACQIIAVDPEPHRRDLAAKLGATVTVDPLAGDPVSAVVQASDGGVERAIEAVGLASTATQAFCALRPGGRATVVGMLPPDVDVAVPGRLLRQGRGIDGTVMGAVRTRADIPRYADLALSGLLHTDVLVTSHRPLSQINDALTDARNRRGVRAMITF